MDIEVLFAQFRKGSDYFNKEMLFGGITPYLSRKMDIFQQQVVTPFDAACRKASPEELEAMGEQI